MARPFLKPGLAAAATLLAAAPASALSIIPVYETSVTNQAAAGQIESAFNTVAALFGDALANPVQVTVSIGWNEVGGQSLPSSAVGASLSFLDGYYSYATVRQALTSAAGASSGSAAGAAGGTLPAMLATGPTNYVVTSAEAKALGLAPDGTALDGYIGFAGATSGFGFDPAAVTSKQYDFQAVAAHELSEILGRISGFDSTGYRTAYDLFRFSAPGQLASSASGRAYFSLDNGKTVLQTFNSGSGDRGDWATTSTTTDAFDAAIARGKRKSVSYVDLAALDALGWNGAAALAGAGSLGGTAFALAGSVPEPSSWALLVTGFALTGAMVRRRGLASTRRFG
ncbi:MAG: NF038122 family metalloprotease [Sphingomonadaceae bacterium]|nr:NF038122 family metalloprotease [Sphingomonadaceae bacterium]